MMPIWPVIRHALAYGAAMSGIISVLLIGALWLNPEIMLNSYPPDIRKKYGPMNQRTKPQRLLVALLLGAVGLGIVATSFREVRTNAAGNIPFLNAFVHLFVMFSVFNVVDLLLLDWPLVAIVPSFFVLRGTEGMPGYKDYGFHFRGFLIGIVIVLVISGLVAGIVAALSGPYLTGTHNATCRETVSKDRMSPRCNTNQMGRTRRNFRFV
jgi:hypothetical protein